jgi:hypothetical protein
LSGFEWTLEPKYNGWRVVLDTTTGKMYNRHGTRLSQESLFRDAADVLCGMFKGETLDCEGLGKRNQLHKGHLILLDRMVDGNYWERTIPIKYSTHEFGNGAQSVSHPPNFHNVKDNILHWLKYMKAFNENNNVIFYEGLVAKRTDVPYQYGETSTCRKFRFTYES